MIPAFILNWVAGKVGTKFAAPLIYCAAIMLLCMVGLAVVKIHDHRVIAAHQAAQDAANSKADRKADDNAAVQRRTDDARLTNESTELNRSTDHASTDLDRRLAFQRCLRLQQSARAAKRQPPACN